MGILEKIKEIELEIARTQKNKATEAHLGRLKGKLARLRTQLLEASKPTTSGSKVPSFEVRKHGDVRVAMVGFPSAGKSTLLSSITNTSSAVGEYEFTTLTCVPGQLEVNGTNVQILDLPGIIEGASEGRGRGRQVIATARTADLILLVIEASQAAQHRPILERELHNIGIRLNERPPDVSLSVKPSCSHNTIHFNATVPLTKLDESTCRAILHDYKIFNADVVIREDISVDQFIDVIEGNRQYIPCLYVYNKIDLISLEQVHQLALQPHSAVISAREGIGLDRFIYILWAEIGVLRIFTKKPRSPPDLTQPFILHSSTPTIRHLCRRIHKDMETRFAYALVWGTSVRHPGQRVGLSHRLHDEDVVQVRQ